MDARPQSAAQTRPDGSQPRVQPGRAQAEQAAPSPDRFLETINAFHQSAVVKTAIDLDLFTAIADGAKTVEEIAAKCQASTRGTRILCDVLTMLGFLEKSDGKYEITHDTFVFLNRHSPAYLGSMAQFLFSAETHEAFRRLTDTVRAGTTDDRALRPNQEIWVNFARSMAPAMAILAGGLADILDVGSHPMRVLDIAAGHGMFGIEVARRNPSAEVVAVDWAPVLTVARENARAAGVESRYRTIEGDALTVDFGSGYDLVLLTNFLHHFDTPTCVNCLRKVAASLRDGGRVALLEFVPNDDRVSPPSQAMFALMMLAMTPAGDARPFSEFERMLREAGFDEIELHEVPPREFAITGVKRPR